MDTGAISRARERLGRDLRRTVDLLEQSESSDWTPFEPAEVAADLSREVAALAAGDELRDRDRLVMHFAASCPIQEIAMANDWADEFVALAERVDTALQRLPCRLTYRPWQIHAFAPALVVLCTAIVVAIDPPQGDIGVTVGVVLTIAVLSFFLTSFIANRSSIAVSADGLWVDNDCVPWTDVREVEVIGFKHHTIAIGLAGRSMKIRALLRSNAIAAAMAVDEASAFCVTPPGQGRRGGGV